jgi:transcriptional regulator with XRE-family HTH domain
VEIYTVLPLHPGDGPTKDRWENLRLDEGLSQEALALKAKIDRSYLGAIERGEYNPTVLTIGRLAIALEVLPAALLELPSNHRWTLRMKRKPT